MDPSPPYSAAQEDSGSRTQLLLTQTAEGQCHARLLTCCPPLSPLQNITNEVRRIEPEKARRIQECETFIESVPDTGSASLLKNKAEETNNKYNHVIQLLGAAQEK